MGRVIREEKLPFLDENVKNGLIRSAAAQLSNAPDSTAFSCRVDRLLVLIPALSTILLRMRPAIIADLADNIDIVAQRLVDFKMAILPSANIEKIVCARPMLLLEEEWSKIPGCLEKLKMYYSNEEDIVHIVEREPIYLVEDIEDILRTLTR